MPAGVSGFISFHFAAATQNITFAARQILHIERKRDISLKSTGVFQRNLPFGRGRSDQNGPGSLNRSLPVAGD
jgi:hypothetical protein